MRKIYLFLMSLAALAVVSSCTVTVEGSYRAKLYQVDEMFNGEVAQSISTQGPFKENGITWLREYVDFVITNTGPLAVESITEYNVSSPTGNAKDPCNLLWEKNGNSVFECHFYTNTTTKKANCDWFDNFHWVDIYRDSRGYLYRFGEDGTAVELSRIQNSKGQWIYWDCLRAYYKFDKDIEPTEW